MITKKDIQLLNLARHVGEWSRDRSKKVGAVITDKTGAVRAIGYNGFPKGASEENDSRHERPAKYLWTEHAERNAIYEAARIGISLDGCTMYVPWFPCMDCARALVQAGMKRLVAIRPDVNDEQWGGHFSAALELLMEVDIELIWADEPTE